MGWAAHARFEEHAVATLAREDLAPEQALHALAGDAEALRRWTPGQGRLDEFVARVLAESREHSVPPCPAAPLEAALDDWERVATVVPAGHPRLAAPGAEVEALGVARVEPLVEGGWAGLGRPVGRWLAARAFASLLALQGEGLRTSVLGLHVALCVLRAEAARACAEAGRVLDPDLLKEAFRRADLLLVHLADPEALARRLSRREAALTSPSWSSTLTKKGQA
jgi:hypothetical protein